MEKDIPFLHQFCGIMGNREKQTSEQRVLRSFHNDEGLNFSNLSHKYLYT